MNTNKFYRRKRNTILFFLLVNMFLPLNSNGQTSNDYAVYEWQPLSKFVKQIKQTKKTNLIIIDIDINSTSKIIKSIDKTTKINAVAIKRIVQGTRNKSVYFSEQPNGIKQGTYSVNTGKLNIQVGKSTIQMDQLEKLDDGWSVYTFGKDLYLYDVDNSALIENILVYADNGQGKKFQEILEEASGKVTSEQKYKIAKVFKTGSLKHVDLKGNITTDLDLAEKWETQASNDLKLEQEREEQQRIAAQLEEEKKLKIQREKEEQTKKIRDIVGVTKAKDLISEKTKDGAYSAPNTMFVNKKWYPIGDDESKDFYIGNNYYLFKANKTAELVVVESYANYSFEKVTPFTWYRDHNNLKLYLDWNNITYRNLVFKDPSLSERKKAEYKKDIEEYIISKREELYGCSYALYDCYIYRLDANFFILKMVMEVGAKGRSQSGYVDTFYLSSSSIKKALEELLNAR